MLKPMGNRCLVERQEEETKLPSGIIIPEAHREKPLQGKVLEIGAKCSAVLKGDTVVYGKYAGTEITLDGKKYLILSEDEILGILGEV